MESKEPARDYKTTILIRKSTVDRISDRKRGKDTYDDVINRDISTLEGQEQKPEPSVQ